VESVSFCLQRFQRFSVLKNVQLFGPPCIYRVPIKAYFWLFVIMHANVDLFKIALTTALQENSLRKTYLIYYVATLPCEIWSIYSECFTFQQDAAQSTSSTGRSKNTSTLEVSYRRAALPLDDFFPTERDPFTHIYLWLWLSISEGRSQFLQKFSGNRQKKDERTDTTDRITFPANAVSKKILTVRKVVSIQYRRASNGTGLQCVRVIPARFSDESDSV